MFSLTSALSNYCQILVRHIFACLFRVRGNKFLSMLKHKNCILDVKSCTQHILNYPTCAHLLDFTPPSEFLPHLKNFTPSPENVRNTIIIAILIFSCRSKESPPEFVTPNSKIVLARVIRVNFLLFGNC